MRRRSMNNTTRAVVVHALLLQGLAAAACEERASVTGPTATGVVTGPPATVPVEVTAGISIGGVVYDTAHRSLSGARVDVIEGMVGDWCHYNVQPAPECILAAITDGSGRFRFTGSPSGIATFGRVTRLRASMEGYLSATLTVDSTTSNTAIEFRLEPSAP
jgi:hypothetical protein